MNANFKYQQKIDAYLSGELKGEAKDTFEEELSTNAELKSEYEVFWMTDQALNYLEYQDFKEKIKSFKSKGPQKKPLVIKRLLIAASTIIVVTFLSLLLYANTYYSNGTLAKEAIVLPPQFTGVASGVDEDLINTMKSFLAEGSFNQAIQLFEDRNLPAVDSIIFYVAAHGYLGAGQPLLALNNFETFLKNSHLNSYDLANSQYNSTLAKLWLGREADAKLDLITIANNPNQIFQMPAQKLLAKLNSPWRKLVF